MSNHEDIDPRDERALQALFDETAAKPTQQQLHNMARAAAKIPEQKASSGVLAWFGLSAWRPALAFGLAGAAALAAWLVIGRSPDVPAPDGPPVAELSAPMPSEEPLAPLEDGEPLDLDEIQLAAEDEPDFVEDDALAGLDGNGFSDGPLAALDLLYDPDDEEELELWNAALGAVFEDAELDDEGDAHDG